MVATLDEIVLAYIGDAGRGEGELAERFPDFDIARLARTQLVMFDSRASAEIEAHVLDRERRYVLTDRGAAAAGIRQ